MMRMKHIVVLRGKACERKDKPTVFAGCETRVGNAMKALIPDDKGVYLVARAGDVAVFTGEERPCRSIRAMRLDEIPAFVDDLGRDKPVTVVYEGGAYKLYCEDTAPGYLDWCVRMLEDVFDVEVYHGMRSFAAGIMGKPRPKAVLEAAAAALAADMRHGGKPGYRWVELEFNGRFARGYLERDGERRTLQEAVASAWEKCVRQVVPA